VATRTFGDTAYRSTTARDQVSYSGEGGSVSALSIHSSLRLVVPADSKLASKIRGKLVAETISKPYGAGVLWRPEPVRYRRQRGVARLTTRPERTQYVQLVGRYELVIPGAGFRLGARGGQMPPGRRPRRRRSSALGRPGETVLGSTRTDRFRCRASERKDWL
jgi:hypothetical protein